MSDVIISVEGLGKKYVLSHQGERGGYARFSEKLESWIKKPFAALAGSGRREVENQVPPTSFHLPQASQEEFWALKDVSFEVKRGEVVGIIGRNGAGKSTLLKILSRITEPSEGRVTLRGRVASLLEVGTGFHPELTGRENIFLNGAILGMSKAEIRKKFDEIVAFAEVERFLDTPVKRYSSGMYVRLAFAVAAHLEPEILVVDEVLAVGDAEFQKKCLGKMKDVATGGRTVLFVSHNLDAVSSLTAKCLLLEKGSKKIFEETSKALGVYRASYLPKEQEYLAKDGPRKKADGIIERVKVITSEAAGLQQHGEPLAFEVELSANRPLSHPSVAIQVISENGTPVTHFWNHAFGSEYLECPNYWKMRCDVPRALLYKGKYYLRVYFSENGGHDMLSHLDMICGFQVEMDRRPRNFPWQHGVSLYLQEFTWGKNK
jgi:lipopolysaccharide transport system ATP-binding protein